MRRKDLLMKMDQEFAELIRRVKLTMDRKGEEFLNAVMDSTFQAHQSTLGGVTYQQYLDQCAEDHKKWGELAVEMERLAEVAAICAQNIAATQKCAYTCKKSELDGLVEDLKILVGSYMDDFDK